MDDLEAHPMELDEENAGARPGKSKLPLIAIGVGVIGLIFGGAGMYMAAQAQNALDAHRAEIAAKPDTTSERLARFEGDLGAIPAQIQSIEDRLAAIGGAQATLTRTTRESREQTQRAFEGVSREVSANRSQLNSTTAKLEELVEQLKSSPPARAAATPAPTPSTAASTSSSSGTTGTTATTAEPVPEGVHLVQSGETLSSIAKDYGITLGEIMAANPSVDPRRMRIGQQIIIPGR